MDTALAADFWPRLALAALAAWRLTHLLAYEGGPFDLVARGRAALGRGPWGRMFDCFHCLSLWVAAPLSPWLADGIAGTVVAWLALSGMACLCERLGQPGVWVQPLPEAAMDAPAADAMTTDPRGEHDGMLRTTTP